MNLFLYLTSNSYRKHWWAAKHLSIYRAFPWMLEYKMWKRGMKVAMKYL